MGGLVYGAARLAEKVGTVDFNHPRNLRLGILVLRTLGALYYAGTAISEIGSGLSHVNPHMFLEGVMSAGMAYELGKEVYQQI